MPRVYRIFWQDGEIQRCVWRVSQLHAKYRLVRCKEENKNCQPCGYEAVDVPSKAKDLAIWLNDNSRVRNDDR